MSSDETQKSRVERFREDQERFREEYLVDYVDCSDCTVTETGPREPGSMGGFHVEMCDTHEGGDLA